MIKQPVIGLLVPPKAGHVPPEAYGLCPDGVQFVAHGIGLGRMALDDYGNAVQRVRDVSRQLADDGAEALCLMGTSLSFFRGGAFNEELIDIMQTETGLPATTMTNAVRDALFALGAKCLAVGTAYDDEVNACLSRFLVTSGFELASLEGMGVVAVDEVLKTPPNEVTKLGIQAFEAATGPVDALFISCGGLPALHLSDALEHRLGVPVVASSTAGVWASLKLLDRSIRSPQLGRLATAGAA